MSRHRTSLTFAIDEDGRAKTIVTKVPDAMDLDSATSSSEDDSEDESDFHILQSQPNSFTLADQDDIPQQSVHGLGAYSRNSFHSSAMASMNSAHYSFKTSSSNSGIKSRSSKGETLHSRPLRSWTAQTGSSASRSDLNVLDKDNIALEGNAEKGDAQQALRAIIRDRDRPRSRSTHDSSMTDRRSASSTQFHSSPPIQHTSYASFNASPTTITDPDGATPSTDHESYVSNGSTRCVCNSSSPDGQFMIQWYVMPEP